ncbi:M14 family zinc carboxypeptidase [Nocardioides sp. GXQ0305]|uniref:M14 family zinc carboxypeptidase n=1 Tax=Nocardioides sp. GXQ0305 TaxID=3423912 RepID=UPI003D7D77D2
MTRPSVPIAALVAAVLVAVVPPAGSAAATLPSGAGTVAAVAPPDAQVGRRKLGESVRGRPIMAYRLGERDEKTVVLFSTMHGDEPRTRRILVSLREGRPIRGVNLWVVPTYNPDGLARGTRKNARGVDLNRNFPYRWADLDGAYESGPRPRSEPETRAVIRFLKDVEPHRIISFHQPLYGVDQDTKSRRFARKVARELRLPRKTFDCGGVCHGTMTMWYNHRFDGAALTAEYGADPSRRMMRKIAPRRVLRVFSARRVKLDQLR